MPYLPILTYHRVINETPTRAVDPHRIAVSADQLRSHLQLLRRFGYRSISLNQYVALLKEGKSAPARSVGITFDDAYEDMTELALPLLKDAGFTATVFSVSAYLGETNRWDDGRAKLLTAEGLRTWRKAGMEVGGHTASHVHLPQVDAVTARREIIDNKKKLEDILGETLPTFAYPYGETTEDVDRMVFEAGYQGAFVTDHGRRNHAENVFRLRRVVVFPRTNGWELLWKVQGWYPAYQDWKKRR